MNLARATGATLLTLRRSRAFWLAVAAPTFIVAFRILLLLGTTDQGSRAQAWDAFMEPNYSFWFGILLMLVAALETALLVDIDRSAGAWKQLFALPISRGAFYLAKVIVAVGLTLFSGVLLLAVSIVAGYLLGAFKPGLGLVQAPPDLLRFVAGLALGTAGCALVLSIYLWLSVRAPNFILPACLGVAGVVANLVGYNSGLVQRFSPWMYGVDVGRILARTPQTQAYAGWSLPVVLLISIVGALLITIAAQLDFKRRDIV